jgi:hypothetical protein
MPAPSWVCQRHSPRRWKSSSPVALSSHAFEPATDRLHGELGRVARDPDADEANVGGHIVHAIRYDLAELLVLEIVHVHAPRIAFRTIIGSAILEVADQLLFLRIDGDDGLLLGLSCNDFRVDIFELGISVGMFRAFICLAIGLAREPELHQLLAYRIGTDRMPHLRQDCCQLLHAFRHPDQGPHGITQCRGLHKPLECRQQPWVVLANRTTPTAGAANLPVRQRFRAQISPAAIDRRTGEPGDLRHQSETAPPGGPHLNRRK